MQSNSPFAGKAREFYKRSINLCRWFSSSFFVVHHQSSIDVTPPSARLHFLCPSCNHHELRTEFLKWFDFCGGKGGERCRWRARPEWPSPVRAFPSSFSVETVHTCPWPTLEMARQFKQTPPQNMEPVPFPPGFLYLFLCTALKIHGYQNALVSDTGTRKFQHWFDLVLLWTPLCK